MRTATSPNETGLFRPHRGVERGAGLGACEPSKRNCRFEDFSQTRTFGTDVLRTWLELGLPPCCGRAESAPRRAL